MTSPGGDRRVRVIISTDVASALAGFRQVSEGLGGVSQAGEQATATTSSWGDKLKNALANLGVQTGFDAVKAGFSAVMSVGLDYERNMNTLQAVSGASADQMKVVGDRAKQLGNDLTIPGASAGDAAAAMQELAKGGLTVDQSMQAAAGTLRLAAAAGVDGAQAAQIQAGALNAFRLSADQANHVADLLANGANAASGEVSDMAAALQQSATVASGFGVNIDETSTTLALFAKNSLIGSDGGTSFKTMLTSLASPTAAQSAALETLGVKAFDASGQFVGMETITGELAAAHSHLTTEQYANAASTAFGTDAVRAANILGAEGTDGWNKMATAVGKAGGAQELAAAQAQGLTGSLDRIVNSGENLALTLFEKVQPALVGIVDFGTSLVGTLTDLLGWFTELPTPIIATTLAIGGMILLRGPLSAMWTSMSTSISTASLSLASIRVSMLEAGMSAGTMQVGMMAASIGVRTLGTALKTAFLSNPIGIALVAATTALSFFSFGNDDAKTAVDGLSEAIDKQTGKLTDSAAATITDTAVKSGAAQAYKNIGGNVADYVDALGGVAGAQDKVNKVIADAKTAAQTAAGGYTDAGAAAATSGGEVDVMTGSLAASNPVLDDATKVADSLKAGLGAMGQAQSNAALTTEGLSGQVGTLNPELEKIKKAAQEATTEVVPFKDSLAAAKDAASEADAATQFLTTSLTLLAGGTISAEQATRANEAAFRDIGATARDLADANQNVADKQAKLDELAAHLGTTLDGQAVSASNLAVTQADVDAASRDLADAQSAVADAGDRQFNANVKVYDSAVQMASAAYEAKASQGDLAGGIADATAVMEGQRQKFIDNYTEAHKFADGEEAARAKGAELATQLGLIPSNVPIAIQQDQLDSATKKAGDLNKQLDAINDRTIRYQVVGTEVKQFEYGYTPADVHADGGYISGAGTGTSDSINSWLSNGEFVVRAAQTSKHRGLLEDINAGRNGYAAGGLVAGDATATGGSAVMAVGSAVTVPDVAAIQAAWDAIAAAVADAWAAVIQPALLALSLQNAATSAEILALRDVSVVPAWDGIGVSISTTTGAVILPTYDALNAGTTNTAATWQALLDATVVPVWAGISNTIQVTWAGTISPVYDMLNAGSNNAGVQFQNLAATTAAAWGQIGSTISGVYSGNIVPAWDGVQGFSNATGSFFSGIQTGMTGAKDQIVSDLAEITTEINKFFDMVAGKTAAAPGATATASVTPTLADGGLITMGTGPRADDVHIRASKGEYVVNAAATAKHKDVLDQINYGGGFADGGLVGEKISGNIQDKVVLGAQAVLEAVVTKALAAFPATFAGGLSGPVPAGARGAFLNAILSKQGTEYVWGAAGPDVFDCSGLMSWGLEQAGIGKGRLTAEGFNSGWPHIPTPKPGDMVTFDTGRLPGQAGHIGAVLDPGAGTMMHTDGAGPARISDYRSRSGLLGFVDPIGGEYVVLPAEDKNGDPPAGGWLGSILDRIKAGGTAAPTATGNVSYNSTAGVEQWRDEVLFSLAFLHESPSLADTVLNQVRSESGGDPNVWNTWDSNAMRGTPSGGLVQLIKPTFDTFALAPYNQNMLDPVSNLIAGENYARHQYGSIAAGMQGHAYDNGGYLQTGWSTVYNGTGAPEPVLSGPQWAAQQSALNHVVNNSNSSNTGQQGGIQIGTIVAAQPGQAISELDWWVQTR